ncbi:hypothetical protein Syun_026702 [Stephania yunnanensis]|uniref:Secreted protein n=1 Tax=Stephania yunnanensis TaxID=152371 RepID=A0AAP0HW00_9MAGN
MLLFLFCQIFPLASDASSISLEMFDESNQLVSFVRVAIQLKSIATLKIRFSETSRKKSNTLVSMEKNFDYLLCLIMR